MGNRKDERRTFEMLEYYITKLKCSYNDLSNLSERNEVLEAAIDAFVNKVYRENIAKVCHINESFITDDILKYIEYGTKYEKIMPDGKYIMAYRPYTNDEVIAIVTGYARNNVFYDYQTQNYQNNFVPASNQETTVSDKKEETKADTSLDNSSEEVKNESETSEENKDEKVKDIVVDMNNATKDENNFDTSYIDSLEINPEELVSINENNKPEEENEDKSEIIKKVKNIVIDMSSVTQDENNSRTADINSLESQKKEDTVESKEIESISANNNTAKIKKLQEYCANLYNEYYESKDKSKEKLNKIVEEENNLYRKTISELTGIDEKDIKEHAIRYVKGGTIESNVDENGNTTKKVRPLTDEETVLIVNRINNLQEDEIKNFLSE